MNTRAPLPAALLGFLLCLLLPPAASRAADDNSAALKLFRQGRYAAAYAALRPRLAREDPEALFHALVIRRNGLDGRPPAQAAELAALTGRLAGQSYVMRQSLADPALPETVADAYRAALAQLIYFGFLPLSDPAPPEEQAARRRAEALNLIYALTQASPAGRYPPAMNFAAYLNLGPQGSAKKALDLLRKSAEAGDHLGMIGLSLLYREGLGGFQDDLKAAHWARRAADAEPPPPRAQNEVGFFYETGRAVTRDLTEAALWYGKSAARQYPPGRHNAARLKSRGRGEPELEAATPF